MKNLVNLFVVLISLSAADVIADESTDYQTDTNVDSVRGLIKPVTKAVLSSEIPARITKIPFRAGDKFNENDLLVEFDCALYLAELASAKARQGADQKRYENNKKLLSLNAISDIEVELSKAEVEIAKADVRIKSIRTKYCKITAPYSGRVIDVAVNEHESVEPEQELLSILDDKKLEIELIVASSWLSWIKRGDEFEILIDETGKKYDARVKQISAVVDPVSQTIRITGEFQNEVSDVLSGSSGSAIFN